MKRVLPIVFGQFMKEKNFLRWFCARVRKYCFEDESRKRFEDYSSRRSIRDTQIRFASIGICTNHSSIKAKYAVVKRIDQMMDCHVFKDDEMDWIAFQLYCASLPVTKAVFSVCKRVKQKMRVKGTK